MVSSAYNYYLSNYVGQEVSKYDTHKKSELRDVYNRMVKVNKASSLYKIAEGEEIKKYAIDLKEAARALTNVASELSDNERSGSGFAKKKATSSDETVVTAKFIGDETGNEVISELSIKIEKLATTQKNVGKYLKQDALSLKKGDYSFDFGIGEYTYEFQFSVKSDDTNRSVQDKLLRLINRSNIGAKASIATNDNNESAIVIESEATGVTNYNGTIFSIKDNNAEGTGKAVDYFGLDKVEKMPQNAKFYVNGMERTSNANTFTVAKQYMINLNDVSEDEITIGLKPDFDAIVENVSELIDKYNSMVDLAKSHADKGYESARLYRDMKAISSYYKSALDSAGFMVEDDARIRVEESLLIQSANEGNLKESLDKLGSFKKAMMNKANNISVNPMAYVDKKLIAYKNPVRNLGSSYMTSIYSGMMFNGYV